LERRLTRRRAVRQPAADIAARAYTGTRARSIEHAATWRATCHAIGSAYATAHAIDTTRDTIDATTDRTPDHAARGTRRQHEGAHRGPRVGLERRRTHHVDATAGAIEAAHQSASAARVRRT
jgi:hypothetical protein